jgi:hypothetical protein
MGNAHEMSSSSDIADALACLERLDAATLASLRPEIERICRGKGVRIQGATAAKPAQLGSVSLGATFVYRTVELWGAEYADSRKPPFEGMVLQVVDFKPRYVNQIVVQQPNGCQSLLPLWEVEKALRLKAVQAVKEATV